jgi:hypothetical protein
VFNQRARLRIERKELGAIVIAILGAQILILAVDGFRESPQQDMFRVAGEQRIPFGSPKHLDDIPTRAGKQRFELLNDLAVAANGSVQTLQIAMESLPQERLVVAVQSAVAMRYALQLTVEYVKQRKAFGGALIDFQTIQFKLAELKTEATIAGVFVNHCVGLHLEGRLDTATASMAKYWVTDLHCKLVDECLQLHGGYGYMSEYPIAQAYKDARVNRIYGGTNEIMKLLIARTL